MLTPRDSSVANLGGGFELAPDIEITSNKHPPSDVESERGTSARLHKLTSERGNDPAPGNEAAKNKTAYECKPLTLEEVENGHDSSLYKIARLNEKGIGFQITILIVEVCATVNLPFAPPRRAGGVRKVDRSDVSELTAWPSTTHKRRCAESK